MESTHPSLAPAAVAAREPAAERTRLQIWLRSDTAVLIAMFAAVGIYYLVPGLLDGWAPGWPPGVVTALNLGSAVAGGALFLALALLRPYLTPIPIAAGISLFYRSRPIGPYLFPLDEFLILAAVAVWALRDGWTLLRGGVPAALAAAQTALRRPFVWAAAGFLVVGVASLILPHPAHRAEALREFRWTIVEPVLFFGLLARYVRSETAIFRVLNAFLIVAAVNAQVGVDQYLFGDTWSMEGVGRAIGLYPGATAFGIFIGRALAMALTLALFLPSLDGAWRRRRAAYLLLCVPLGLGVLFSFARGAWIGVFAALVVVALLAGARRILYPLIAAAVVAVPAVLLLFGNIARFTLTDSSNLSRLVIWQAALRVLRDHPLTGIGPDQFLYQDPKYGIPNTRFQTVNHPHDWVLDTWLRLGAWGLVVMIATIVVFFVSALRAYRGRRGTLVGAIVLALIAGMTDHVVHGFVDQAYFTQDLALTFWLLIGLLGAVLALPRAAVAAVPAAAEAALPAEPAEAVA